MPGSFVESERKKQGGTKDKRQEREGEAVGKYSERVSRLAEHLQGKGQPLEGMCCYPVAQSCSTL